MFLKESISGFVAAVLLFMLLNDHPFVHSSPLPLIIPSISLKPVKPPSLKDFNIFFKEAFLKCSNSPDFDPLKRALDTAFSASNMVFNFPSSKEFLNNSIDELVKSLAADCHRFNTKSSDEPDFIKKRISTVHAVLVLVKECESKHLKIPDHLSVVFFRFIFRFAPLDVPVSKFFNYISINISESLRLNLFTTLPDIFDPRIHRFPIFSIIAEGNEKVLAAGITYITGFYQKIIEELDPKDEKEAVAIQDLLSAAAIAVVSTDFYESLYDILLDALSKADIYYLLTNQFFVKRFIHVLSNNPDLLEPAVNIFLKESNLLKIQKLYEQVEFGKLFTKMQEIDAVLVDAKLGLLSESAQNQIKTALIHYDKYVITLNWMNELLNIETDIHSNDLVDHQNIYANLKIALKNYSMFKVYDPEHFDKVYAVIYNFIAKFLKSLEKNLLDYSEDLELATEHFNILVAAFDLIVSTSSIASNKLSAIFAIIDFFNVNIGSSYCGDYDEFDDDEEQLDGDDENNEKKYLKLAVGCIRQYFDKFIKNRSFIKITMKEYKSLFQFLKFTQSNPLLELNAILLLELGVFRSKSTVENVHLVLIELDVFTPALIIRYFYIEFENASFQLGTGYLAELLDYLKTEQFLTKTQLEIIEKLISTSDNN